MQLLVMLIQPVYPPPRAFIRWIPCITKIGATKWTHNQNGPLLYLLFRIQICPSTVEIDRLLNSNRYRYRYRLLKVGSNRYRYRCRLFRAKPNRYRYRCRLYERKCNRYRYRLIIIKSYRYRYLTDTDTDC